MNSDLTLSKALVRLKHQGYELDFNVRNQKLICHEKNVELAPEHFVIDMTLRFEGMTNPDDQSILLAISSREHDLKGVLVNGFGISADPDVSEVISRLKGS